MERASALSWAFIGMCGCIAAIAFLVYKKRGQNTGGEDRMVLPDGWTTWTDEVSGAPCFEHISGITQWEVPEGTTYTSAKATPAIAMTKMFRNPLKRKNEGADSQNSHGRQETQLPEDWSTDWDQEGNKYCK